MSVRIIKWFYTAEEAKKSMNKFIDENFKDVHNEKFGIVEVCITMEMS